MLLWSVLTKLLYGDGASAGPSDSLHPDAFEKAQELGSALANGLPPPFDASVWARKDANEVLVKDGPEVLKAYLDAAAPLRIIGLYTFGEFFQQVGSLDL